MRESILTAVLIDAVPALGAGRATYVSVGLIIDDRAVAWGEFAAGHTQAPTASQLVELRALLSQALVGQPLRASELTELIGRLESVKLRDVLGDDARLGIGLEQAIVSAVADAENVSQATVLSHAFPPDSRVNVDPLLVLEVDNTQATAEVMQRMIGLAPAGLGYRLVAGGAVESIGKHGEYLQRFVRELSMLLMGQDNPVHRPPIIYLGLNGSLGALTADPLRELGQILGHISGLEKAAGAIPLWLEDPLMIEDEVVNAAALYQLRDYMRVRDMRTRIIARTRTTSLDDLQMLCETDAVDGACLYLGEWGGLIALVDSVSLLRAAGKSVILAHDKLVTPDQLKFLLAVAQALQVDAVLLNVGEEGEVSLPGYAVLLMHRERVWQRHSADRNA